MNNRMQIVEHYVTGTTSSLLYLTSYYKVEVEFQNWQYFASEYKISGELSPGNFFIWYFWPCWVNIALRRFFFYLSGFTILLGITFKPEQDLLTVVFQGPKEAIIGLLFGIAWALLVTLFPGKKLWIRGL